MRQAQELSGWGEWGTAYEGKQDETGGGWDRRAIPR